MMKVVRDEWNPTIELLIDWLGPNSRFERKEDIGYIVVAAIKRDMRKQRGFGDQTPYRPLKIKARYHGHKTLRATKKNLGRAVRGARIRNETFTDRSGRVRTKKVVDVVDKTVVTSGTKALIDTAQLLKSWDVLGVHEDYVDVGNTTAPEAAKAAYNDDRGDWDWGRKNTKMVLNAILADLDKRIFN